MVLREIARARVIRLITPSPVDQARVAVVLENTRRLLSRIRHPALQDLRGLTRLLHHRPDLQRPLRLAVVQQEYLRLRLRIHRIFNQAWMGW